MITLEAAESIHKSSLIAGTAGAHRVISVQSDAQFQEFCAAGGRQLSPEQCRRERADGHLMVVEQRGQAAARCSVWWQYVPAHATERIGIIGHYAAESDAAAAAVLEGAITLLAQNGCTYAVGPMDGSTFRAYRLVTERAVDGAERSPYFLEPNTPAAWVSHFEDAGFSTIAHYVSAIADLYPDVKLSQLRAQVMHAGINVRPIFMDAFDTELRGIYRVVTASFRDNFLYSPIDEGEFMAQYGAARLFTRPELVWVAERGGDTVGFVFAYPDLAQQQRGEPIDTVIIKTLAVTPDVGGLGLGSLLTAEVQQAALELGYTQAIHALMISDNRSRRISAHYGRVMRKYALYGKRVI